MARRCGEGEAAVKRPLRCAGPWGRRAERGYWARPLRPGGRFPTLLSPLRTPPQPSSGMDSPTDHPHGAARDVINADAIRAAIDRRSQQRRDHADIARWLRSHFFRWAIGRFAHVMNGSGLLVLNPPWHFDQQMQALLPALARTLGESADAAGAVQWLKQAE